MIEEGQKGASGHHFKVGGPEDMTVAQAPLREFIE